MDTNKGKIELLDTPGVLWPKFESRETGLKLAATNAVKEDVFDPEEIAKWLLEWITNNYPLALEKHYAMNEFPCDGGSFFELIGEKRGLLTTGGAVDRLRTSLHIIKEFRDGKLGRFSLEKPQ
jgi:ribosome biogenesis GTPase A